ncbi:hypothetical protein DPMN_157975 [Dreissena polymorpha]|uniref:Uncharacterized protein n=1 Tax=Dreissena polymorpha TaxID=45954 RepID=A0A9D4ELG5_DREPO|nr:hypothetical protein DPMN_157975 [Dreissena polymorpha]
MLNTYIDIRGAHTVPMSLETALKTLNIVDETFIWDFQTNLRAHAEAALQSIMDRVSKRSDEERVEHGAQTDLIGELGSGRSEIKSNIIRIIGLIKKESRTDLKTYCLGLSYVKQ